MAVAIYVPALQGIFETVPLPLSWLTGVALIGLLNIVLIEIAKWFFRNRQKLTISTAYAK
jgi:hypothetical protein